MKRPKFAPDIKLADLTAEDVLCPDCGYNLRGLDGGRCPECGLEFTVEGVHASQVPWTRRKSIGWLRSIHLTATMNTKRLAYEVCRGQSLREARRLHWTVVAFVAAAAFLACTLLVTTESDTVFICLGVFSFAVLVAMVATVPFVAVWIIPALGYRDDHERAKAVVLYSSARLLDLGLACLCFAVGMMSSQIFRSRDLAEDVTYGFSISGNIVGFSAGLLWLWGASSLIGLVSHYRWFGRLAVLLALLVAIGGWVAIINIVFYGVYDRCF